MKAEELMIGDWVRPIYRGEDFIGGVFPFKISYINAADNDDPCVAGGCHCAIDIKDIEPIPITPEILEKNGFSKHARRRNVWLSKDMRIEVNCLSNMTGRDFSVHIDNEDYDTIGSADIQYVHELQHALRLCEIDKEIEIR